jgi:fusion and transport protein UGO1
MSTSREGVNPLRPYYIPPTIGERSEVISSPGPNPFGTSNATKSLNYASKARDVLTDIDYNDYLGDTSPTVVQNVKDFIDELIWKYSSILMAQPFEVAKIILQVRDQDEKAALTSPTGTDMLKKRTSSHGGSIYDVSVPRWKLRGVLCSSLLVC